MDQPDVKPRRREWWSRSRCLYRARADKVYREVQRRLGPWVPGDQQQSGEILCPICGTALMWFRRRAEAAEVDAACGQTGCFAGEGITRVVVR